MKIIEEIIKDLEIPKIQPREVRVGLYWTAVRSRYTGMGHTLKPPEKLTITDAGKLDALSMMELCKMALSENTLDASVGTAAVNSLIPVPKECDEGNVNDEVKRMAKGKTISIIGRFPTNDELKEVAKKCYVLEMEPQGDEYPASACDEILPKCDFNLITATTLINHTLDHLLELGSGGYNVVLGPSTPFHPVLFDRGVDMLAGVRIMDQKALFSTITQGVKKFDKIGGVVPVYLRRK